MEFKIVSDIIPFNTGKHRKENWQSPESDKHMAAHELLKNKNLSGFYSCKFNSQNQEFTSVISECVGLSIEDAESITNELNSIGG